jgi:hypothetical protein
VEQAGPGATIGLKGTAGSTRRNLGASLTTAPSKPLELSPAERAALDRCSRYMTCAKAAFGPRAPLRLPYALALVSRQEGSSLEELAASMQLSVSTASLDLRMLGHEDRKGGPGMGLIEQSPDPLNGRRNNYRVTERGRQLLNVFAKVLEGNG